ncbi:MAG: SDR family NAD(P)-dependent oxidoreductase [Tenericutes bacterium]|nr:SDR family NAD(P)-dependent oxidoreductase [Mycoplasmatota bacterium]
MQKVAIVTGASSGIGKANVELLLKEKIHVIAFARNIEKIEAVKKEFKPLTKNANLDFVIGDLSNNKSTHQAGQDLVDFVNKKYNGQLDILMNVAGRVTSGYHENEDGNEITFATNHLSVFILTYYLTPLLKKAKDPRVLVVSSLSHYRASINWNNIQNKKCYNILKAYKRSKLYNVFFVKEYARKFKDIPIFAIDPGLVKTEIGGKNTTGLARFAWNLRKSGGTDVYYPSKFMVDVALKPEYKALSGHYIKEGKSIPSNKITYNEEHAKRLWSYSESLTQIDFK